MQPQLTRLPPLRPRRCALTTAPGSTRDAAASAPDPFGLTDRERRVLELVARSASNCQVGETLFMAVKTAIVHVSRILAKLDVRSRTEAAAVAHRRQLV